jgi:hypothetical protein
VQVRSENLTHGMPPDNTPGSGRGVTASGGLWGSMTKLFISHSSKDDAFVRALMTAEVLLLIEQLERG